MYIFETLLNFFPLFTFILWNEFPCEQLLQLDQITLYLDLVGRSARLTTDGGPAYSPQEAISLSSYFYCTTNPSIYTLIYPMPC